jgi:hypothetical protein
MESISTYIEKELKLKVNIEKSSVTRPWLSKLLGFTFYRKKEGKAITVHRKSIAAYKEKIRLVTCRSKPYPMEERMMQIRRLNYEWGNYFKLSEAKSVFERLDARVRSRVRLCYWKDWKKPKTRAKQLERLGIKPKQAYMWGNTRRGYWRTVQSPILTRAIDNAFLKNEGLICLKDIVTT